MPFFAVLPLALIALLAYAATRPNTFRVQRSLRIAAPPQVIADATPKAPDAPVAPSNPNKPLVDSPENRAKQCQLARSNLALLQTNYQVSAPQGDDGKAQVLDENGRKQAIDRAADQVAFYCK